MVELIFFLLLVVLQRCRRVVRAVVDPGYLCDR